MIPTPPTSSEMPTMPVATTVIAAAMLRNWSTNSWTASTRKLSGSPIRIVARAAEEELDLRLAPPR